MTLDQVLAAQNAKVALGKRDTDLQHTFRYPEVGYSEMSLFDIRPEVCLAAGGARHGDIVLTEGDLVATVIGVKGSRARGLFVHIEGGDGAGVFWERRKVRVVANVSVPEGGMPGRKSPSEGVPWFVPTFLYKAGLAAPKVQPFDIRDEVCLKVGGFRHGQIVETFDNPDQEMVVIGVRRDEVDEQVSLWFHPKGAPGAGTIPFQHLSNIRWLGTKWVQERLPRQSSNSKKTTKKSSRKYKKKSKTNQRKFGEPGTNYTFLYPAGAREATIEDFDTRPDRCISAGGARHGDIVLFPDGVVATVIGMKPVLEQRMLWVHKEGDEGASAVEGTPLLRVVSNVSVPEGGLPDGAAPSVAVPWLVPSFFYKAGLNVSRVQLFDIRDDVCLKVGGFRHGQIVMLPDLRMMVVIGVKRNSSSVFGNVALWCRPLAEDGAIAVPWVDLTRFQWVSTQALPEHAPPRTISTSGELKLQRTFHYPVHSTKKIEGFDIHPEVCMRVGGARHGDIVLVEQGFVASVIGVRENDGGSPRLWVHGEGAAGASPIEDTAEELRVVGQVTRVPSGGLPGGAAPSDGVDWLEPTFRYPLEDGTEGIFDIRDELVFAVSGGFKHGQILQLAGPDAADIVVIGVRLNAPTGEVALHASPLDRPMAARVTLASLRAMRVVGTRHVEEQPLGRKRIVGQ